jgi:hypothetical protein
MADLIPLNGSPGIGRSFADRQPGTLNLDIDQVRCLIGGWREDLQAAGEMVRPVAVSTARAHLAAGRDVIMPQFFDAGEEIALFRAAAENDSGCFREVVIMNTREGSVERFNDRGRRRAGSLAWAGQVNRGKGWRFAAAGVHVRRLDLGASIALVERAVSEHGVDDVAAPACQADDGGVDGKGHDRNLGPKSDGGVRVCAAHRGFRGLVADTPGSFEASAHLSTSGLAVEKVTTGGSFTLTTPRFLPAAPDPNGGRGANACREA